MRKIFEERVRLVVYLESTDLQKLTQAARADGKTVVEYARDLLLENLGEERNRVLRPRNHRTPKARTGSAVEVHERTEDQPVLKPGKCAHAKERGHLCYKCDPKFGLPSLSD